MLNTVKGTEKSAESTQNAQIILPTPGDCYRTGPCSSVRAKGDWTLLTVIVHAAGHQLGRQPVGCLRLLSCRLYVLHPLFHFRQRTEHGKRVSAESGY